MTALFIRFQKSISVFFAQLLYAQLLAPLYVQANSPVPLPVVLRMNKDWHNGLPPAVKQRSTAGLSVNHEEVRQRGNAEAPKNAKKFFGGGPDQPEMQAFTSVNGSNLVDMFTGDFSYSIPLMDVGGYPLTLGYRSGITMDQEASWVGLGWNLNPGTVSRNMRGLPDDFTGQSDSITKVMTMNPNKTTGATVGADVEVVGLPVNIGVSLGLSKNNYRGWGMESGLNASISAGVGGKGSMTAGLSFNNNSQDGITVTPGFTLQASRTNAENNLGYGGSFSISAPYNSRAGIRVLQMSAGLKQYRESGKDKLTSASSHYQTHISFASPTFVPGISIPYTSEQFSFTAKVGSEVIAFHPSLSISGYQSKQYIAYADTSKTMPAYGYINYQNAEGDIDALLDFNREKELPYREKPAMPHIAMPFYTYDLFSFSGEGSTGQFRAYRGDIGFIRDHFMRTKDASNNYSLDVGLGDLVHAGVDVNINRSITQSGAWKNDNSLASVLQFRKSDGAFRSVYFRNPAEKTSVDTAFFNAVGGDNTVTPVLYQAGSGSSFVQATTMLAHYKDKLPLNKTSSLTKTNTVRANRDKQSQVVSFLTASEADAAALDKYIESYSMNVFNPLKCAGKEAQPSEGAGTGLPGVYFKQSMNFTGTPVPQVDIRFDNVQPPAGFGTTNFSAQWNGRLRAPYTGKYKIRTASDDGMRIWLNDSLILNNWYVHGEIIKDTTLNLISGQFYKLRMEYFQQKGKSVSKFHWITPGENLSGQASNIKQEYLYGPEQTTWQDATLLREKRNNGFRKSTHLSEITVLNGDGKRYVYGLPVYNLKQKETSFSANGRYGGNSLAGLVAYSDADNSTNNNQGRDKYYSSEEVPAYAHSFLLTGLLSPDYVDLTGNGISDDDLGDAVKFNYTRVAGLGNPYQWRSPMAKDSASFSLNLKTDYRDDKGNLVYGDKELWYMHSILSKTMVATFTLENRDDLPSIDARGNATTGKAKRLKEINLYSKADFFKYGTGAKPVKTVHFEYSYELCPGAYGNAAQGKLTLTRLWFTYNGNAKGQKNPYVFRYHANNPAYNLRSYDSWGNYKDPKQNPGYTDIKPVNNADYPFPLQDSSLAAYNAGAWNLDSIVLPSGGGMRVLYESDDYGFVQNRIAMQMCTIRGFGKSSNDGSSPRQQLYAKDLLQPQYLYMFINVPRAVTTDKEVYEYYLRNVEKLFVRLSVKVPDDQYGSGFENVPLYVRIDGQQYGRVSNNVIWVKVKGIAKDGEEGDQSPFTRATFQFLRQNLPSKAYPGSEVGDNLGAAEAVKMIVAQSDNVKTMMLGYDNYARSKGWAQDFDSSRSYVRLNNPYRKKYGGGHRVKKLLIFDNWDKMTTQRAAVYGQEYDYSMEETLNGKTQSISSGVASFEPGIGGEENPFRLPVEYKEQLGVLGPFNLGYTEEPLGESLFPAPSVGYRSVRTKSIYNKNVKSANGYTENRFYTAYDFPTFVDRSIIDEQTKKRFRPALANFLRINARHFMNISQGFKIELNDMHGKPRSTAMYAQNDPKNQVTYTEYFYKTENGQADSKRLSNVAMVIGADGTVNESAIIGKDVELMVDSREQQSVVNGSNLNFNADIFAIPFIPGIAAIPTALSMPQREENRFRSISMTKVIQRYGIIDSIVQIDKGSRVVSRQLVFDAETGDALVNQTVNGFDDPVYSFSYPSHWAYDAMGLAYKNIEMQFSHLSIQNGKMVAGLPAGAENLFVSGDEVIASGKPKTAGTDCNADFSSFPVLRKLWVVDSSVNRTGTRALYLVDRDGTPYTGYDVTVKVIRSGRRNQLGSVGSITSLENPVRLNGATNKKELMVNAAAKVLNATAQTYREQWKVPDNKKFAIGASDNVCGPGFTYVDSLKKCIKDTVPYNTDTTKICLTVESYADYTSCGTLLYSQFTDSLTSFSRTQVDISNNYWKNPAGNTCGITPAPNRSSGSGGTPKVASLAKTVNKDSTNTQSVSLMAAAAAATTPSACEPDQSPRGGLGPLNRTGIWRCCDLVPTGNWWDIIRTITIPATGTYYFGVGADNYVRVFVDNNRIYTNETFSSQPANLENFRFWHLLPVTLTAGTHQLRISAMDQGAAKSVGLELYNNTSAQLQAATSDNDLNILFSTRNLVGEAQTIVNACPAGYTSVTLPGGQQVCRMSYDVPPAQLAARCIGLTDSLINPYTSGVWGNWHADRSYVVYADRAETDAQAATNTRTNGTIPSFPAFWALQSGKWTALPDTNTWVWNTRSTLFNKRGLELENNDPLGRYNAGLYGYQASLPVAVVQNAKYREVAYEGFEDYGFKTQYCDSACVASRHIDFNSYQQWLDTTNRHSGKFSLRVPGGQQAGISVNLGNPASDTTVSPLNFRTVTAACSNYGQALRDIRIGADRILPGFRPTAGSTMLLSAWVKESVACGSGGYTNNHIVISYGTGGTTSLSPAGPVIEGWQRYEAVLSVPANATSFNISLQAASGVNAYFDDLRLHPFNANMKSFVYHPGNLRLMAELDENNYASFYEYDDEGTLIRVKKETIRGIQTIKETRSALKK